MATIAMTMRHVPTNQAPFPVLATTKNSEATWTLMKMPNQALLVSLRSIVLTATMEAAHTAAQFQMDVPVQDHAGLLLKTKEHACPTMLQRIWIVKQVP